MQHFGVRELRNNISKYSKCAESGEYSVITKNGSPLSINVPFTEEMLLQGVNKSLAIQLFKDGVLTLVQASKLANLKIDEFASVLGRLEISIYGYDSDELNEELENW